MKNVKNMFGGKKQNVKLAIKNTNIQNRTKII